MGALVLACGKDAGHGASPMFADRDDLEVHEVAAKPGRTEVDPLVKGLDGRRLLVRGTDADLAAVVLRLLRTERLAEVPVGYLPTSEDSVVARIWDLPTDPGRALDLALRADPDPVPLIRDDSGGVIVGEGVFRPVRGVAYCDETQVLRGQAGQLTVGPDPDRGPGLVVRVVRRQLLVRRTTVTQGRAVQVGCVPSAPVSDGVVHPRQVTKWTWYRHTEDLRLVRGLI
ncbi:hypothetical protein [Kutzneria albida]|uniref:Uncharacterized protein n=1 Tax=Kutzneria albida DSM 43870 TaxID=1449976 RepID=W5WN18_9PSEU|nr:hypothetical protein KALB_8595 [Kutzneria albida DSM 43870]